MSSNSLVGSSLQSSLVFNWVFLVEFIVCGVLTLFFLFYFNRLFATLVSLSLRAWTWHQYRVYIDIQALQLSLLGGRIFFKGVRYHGNNETIFIHSGYITWQYWLRNIQGLGIGNADNPRSNSRDAKSRSSDADKNDSSQSQPVDFEKGGAKSPEDLPCRLALNLKGVEWFVYNRSMAYDAIVEGITQKSEHVKSEAASAAEENPSLRKRGGRNDTEEHATSEKSSCAGTPLVFSTPSERRTFNSVPDNDANIDYGKKAASDFMLLRFLPVHIDCNKAAIVMGNENTRSVLITKFEKASGLVDAASSSNPLDHYKQVLNFEFVHPVIQMKPNDDFKEDQAAAALRVKDGIAVRQHAEKQETHSHSFFHRHRRRAWHKLKDLVPYFQNSVGSFDSRNVVNAQNPNSQIQNGGNNRWQGLSRYLDDDEQDEQAKWLGIEYAVVSTIVDSPKATMSYYWDIPGPVPQVVGQNSGFSADINGSNPPEWGIDLSVEGAMINYGPWADRQRADLQKAFFPALCKDSEPAPKLKPGQTRVATVFKLYIELEKETILRVPIREASKNWKWKRQADAMAHGRGPGKNRHSKGPWRLRKTDRGTKGPEVRSFGWIDIKVSPNASFTYAMDMVAGLSGFNNSLKLDVLGTEITTSVNHGLLWRSSGVQISCDLSNPLKWNGLHTWQFDINSKDLELFILREHIFLLIDLVDDWASGPLQEYLTFVPFKYLVTLNFTDFKLYVNVNDSNIINNPSDLEDNTFIVVFGAKLKAVQTIPLDKFRPHRNDVSFKVDAADGGLNLIVPPWNTQATFLSNSQIATLQTLNITGKYQYNATTSPSNTDTLLLDVSGQGLIAQIYGFVIRYFLKIKDNYFGDDMHFKTLEEYQQSIVNPEANGLASQSYKKSNDLDVILTVGTENANLILPSNLYSCKRHIRIEVPSISLDLRFTNYYMDLQASFSSLAFSAGEEDDGDTSLSSSTSRTQLFVDDVNIYGHRLFGLPPAEPTYVCNWDFGVGAVTGECSTEFLSLLVAGGRGFGFSFDDDENALPPISIPVLHDVTFLRATVKPVRVWVHVGEAALLLSTGHIKLNFDDWAGSHFSEKLKLSIPDLVVASVDADSALRHKSRSQHPVETHACIKTDVSLTMIERKLEFFKDRDLQQAHVRRHDQRTHRAGFLLHDLANNEAALPNELVDPPAMCSPPLPPPLLPSDSSSSALDSRSASSKSTLFPPKSEGMRRSSFLSTASSNSLDAARLRRNDSGTVNSTHETAGQGRAPRSYSRPTLAPRDVSASTGRQSSFYSAVGDHAERKGMTPSNVAFSSSYMPPYFPLEEVEPDMADLPILGSKDLWEDPDVNQITLEDIDETKFDEKAVHSSFIIQFKSGVRAFFKPTVIDTVANLLGSLQAVEPEDILDTLHVDGVGAIFASMKQQLSTGKTTDLNIRLPALHLRFLNFSSSKSINPHGEVDQYDIKLSGLVLTSRSRLASQSPENTSKSREYSATHMRCNSLKVSAKEQLQDMHEDQAAIDAGVEDVVFWMVSDDNLTANVNVKNLELATRSNKLEYLASLIHRTSVLASDFGDTFTALQNQQRRRVQAFVYRLANAGRDAPDPLILTRPSYVLRSANYHLRSEDTWKVVTRFRQMYSWLDGNIKEELATASRENSDVCPDDGRAAVVTLFQRWRGWDLLDAEKCRVMTNIYGPLEEIHSKTLPPQPTKLSFKTRTIRLVLDPGPKQTELAFNTLTACADINSCKDSSTAVQSSVAAQPDTVLVQVYCEDTSINLNWELCELIENILKRYQNQESKLKSPVSSELASSKSASSPMERRIHVIIATGKGLVALDTINLRFMWLSDGLRSSALLKDCPDTGLQMNVMLSAAAATTKIRSRSYELLQSQLLHPSLYVAHEKRANGSSFKPCWRIAANCQDLIWSVEQDILAILEVVDLVIGDEIASLYKISKSIPSANKASPTPSPGNTPKSSVDINLALFLDRYSISIPLLPSLAYNITGLVARASMEARLDSDIVFDFDIQENSHDIRTRESHKPRSIALIEMSPMNGRLPVRMTETENIVSFFASLEPVELDATAIHNVLNAISRPEISSVIKQLHQELDTIQTHLSDLFGPSLQPTKDSTTDVSKTLIYDVHLTLEGFDIFADASTVANGHETARFSFTLGSSQVAITNRLEQHGPQLSSPDVKMVLQQIMIGLSRRTQYGMESCGNLIFAAELGANTKKSSSGQEIRSYYVRSESLNVNLFADTASTILDVFEHLQNKIKDLDLTRERQYLRKLSKPAPRITIDEENESQASDTLSNGIFGSLYAVELLNIQVMWMVGDSALSSPLEREIYENEDLVLSFKRIDLSTKRENSAKLTIEDFQLQMVPASQPNKVRRSMNSALLPEVVFNVAYVSTPSAHRLAFQAVGKSLDLRLTSQFMIAGAGIKKSIGTAVEKVKAASVSWNTGPVEETKNQRKPYFGSKRIESLLVDADFAGAVVYLQSIQTGGPLGSQSFRGARTTQHGKYGQFVGDDLNTNTVLRAPGLAFKIEYKDNGKDDPSLNAEVKVERSANTLYPSVVPLILEMSNSVKEIFSEENESQQSSLKAIPPKLKGGEEENILTADPSAVLGRTKLNLGLRICRQEFSLSCQPIALVTATAHFDDIYITINTLRTPDHGHFFAVSACFSKLQASVQHVYSRGSTGSFEVETMVLSFMNSKHVSGTSGVSAILKISPMKVHINAKQLQDFMLFREIWVPADDRKAPKAPVRPTPSRTTSQSQMILVQRYQQVAATGAFPWNATVHVEEFDVQLDLGQAIGKPAFIISKFWISSKKSSDWEQNLCFGFDEVGVNCSGRLSGFVALQNFRVNTSIRWPAREKALNETPLVEAALKFSKLRVKASFDYQPFLVADITTFEFLMYNVRNNPGSKIDRLVATLDGDTVQVFCTTSSAAQALALYQAFVKLAQEKKANFEASLQEIEKFTRRKSATSATSLSVMTKPLSQEHKETTKSPISLHTNVVVTLKAVNLGAFPSTFVDNQIFKIEVLDAEARFAVNLDAGKVHSQLGLTLGQLRIGLAGIRRLSSTSASIGDISVEDVVSNATGSRGGTILKVPKVEASMQTWQLPDSNHIDYIFKSSFEGKVEVGWNYSRIGFIRGMWATHSKTLAQRLGKPLAPSAVRITGVPNAASDSDESDGDKDKEKEQRKITAEVNVPQSKYEYNPLEPPIIETPQLRDMGEATPPLEWIGLHRERLPNLTHQIVIVALLEVASEVEDAYGKILGSSYQ